MKARFLFSLILLLSHFVSNAQDIITRKNGEDVQAKVSMVTPSEVRYTLYNAPDSGTIILMKSEILMIRYEDGTKDIFTNEQASIASSNIDYCSKGNQDAKQHYRRYKAAGTGTFLTAFFAGPLFGLIPAIACSSTPPKDRNLDYPNEELMKNRLYKKCYTEQARKKKANKVWANYGIGVGVLLALIIIAGV